MIFAFVNELTSLIYQRQKYDSGSMPSLYIMRNIYLVVSFAFSAANVVSSFLTFHIFGEIICVYFIWLRNTYENSVCF